MIDFQKVILTPGLKFTLKSIQRGRTYEHPITNTCKVPFTHLSIDNNLDCFVCSCSAWLPIPVGKISDFNKLSDIWNSPIAKMIQSDVTENKFTWCAVTHCGIVHQSNQQVKYNIAIGIDDSCNLACPSCRRELHMLDSGPEFENKITNMNHIMRLLEEFEHPVEIALGVSGDALASHITRHLLLNYHPTPRQSFSISTNGLLIKKIIPNSPIRSHMKSIAISVDAGSANVYEQVRRPGKWKILLENLEWMSENRGSTQVKLMFIVQKTNFKDIAAFDELCRRLNFIGSLQPLFDWGTWNSQPVKNPDAYTIANGTYLDHDIANPTHPEHLEFLTIIRNTYNQNTNLNISPYFNKFK
jgi:hypothetical protein